MFRSARTVTILSMFAQFIAFFRTVIIASAFGASDTIDGYYLGLMAPTFLATVIVGWLQISFVGRYTELLTHGNDHLAKLFRSRLLWLLSGFVLLCTTACILFPEIVMGGFLKDTQAALKTVSADALRIIGWSIIPLVIADYLGIVLNSHGRFFIVALAPLLNATISVLALWLWPDKDLAVLSWTLLIGSFVQLFVVLGGVAIMKLTFSFRTTEVAGETKTAILLALPLMPAMMMANAMPILLQVHFSRLGEGAVAIYGYASRLHGALSQVLVIGLSTALLPHLAVLWAKRENYEINQLFRRLARMGMLVSVYLVAGIALLGEPAVEFLLGRGRFDANTIQQVALVWLLLSFGIFPFAFGTFIAKLCQAMRLPIFIFISSLISFTITWLMVNWGSARGQFSVIALAPALAFTATTFFWIIWYLRRFSASQTLVRDLFFALVRSVAVITPALMADMAIASFMDGLPNSIILFVRGAAFTTFGAAVLFHTKLDRWFFAINPR